MLHLVEILFWDELSGICVEKFDFYGIFDDEVCVSLVRQHAGDIGQRLE